MKKTRHGYRYHPLYARWLQMKGRCYNKRNKAYANYGGRGIYVCDEWVETPAVFVEWGLANGYKRRLTVERIDNDGPYSPDNCCFATRKQQNRNKRQPRWTKARDGKKHGLPLGVYKEGNSFYSTVCNNYKQKRVGTFSTVEAAVNARNNALEKLNG